MTAEQRQFVRAVIDQAARGQVKYRHHVTRLAAERQCDEALAKIGYPEHQPAAHCGLCGQTVCKCGLEDWVPPQAA